MTHFVVLVELPAGTVSDRYEDELARRLAPFSEELAVKPYRDYVENVDRVKQRYVEMYQKSGQLDARLAVDDVPWQRIIKITNMCHSEDEREWYYLDAENGRPYRMSTYNPDSKWDWYVVGGRYHGYFTAKPNLSSADRNRIALGAPSWVNEGWPIEAYACDGGPVGLLDLGARRAAETSKARDRYNRYQSLVAGLEEARSWPEMLEIYGEQNVDDARTAYREQPRIQAVREDRDFFWGCPVEEFKWGEELYVQRAHDGAVPGYSHLTLDGEWLAPGEMGWFAMSSDTVESRDAYDAQVNKRVNSLDPEVVLLAVDCHI